MAGVMNVLHGLDVAATIAIVAAMWVHGGDAAGFLSVSLAAVSLAAVAYTVGGIRHAVAAPAKAANTSA